jgi:DNA repair protein RecO (recombination protein O)
MTLMVTDAVVLHAFDYLESSRILRLATRDAGVRSVLARGARSSRKRFGSAVDLFAQGTAQIHTKPGRDLDTLAALDVSRARPELAADLGRFTGASALAELMLRCAIAVAEPSVYDALLVGLDAVGAAAPGQARAATLASAWRLVAELGFAPNVDACGSCQAELEAEATVRFSHPAGGALCERCARLAPSGRALPAEARVALRAWLSGGADVSTLSDLDARAHQRLLREFLREHLADGRPLRAFEVWEHDGWSAA